MQLAETKSLPQPPAATSRPSKPVYQPVVVVDTKGMPEERWLQYRRKGICGSDAAVALGLSPFATARDLYYDKIGEQSTSEPEENSIAKALGHILEPYVAKLFSEQTGIPLQKETAMYAHPKYPFLMANLDYTAADGRKIIVDCKTTTCFRANDWADDCIPLHYEIQGRHYMAIMNYDEIYFACLVLGTNELIIRHLKRDYQKEQQLIFDLSLFWSNVTNRIPPAYTEDSELVLKSIRRHYGKLNPAAPVVDLSQEYQEAFQKYFVLEEQKKELKKQVDTLDKQMKQLYAPILDNLGDRCEGVCKSGKNEFHISCKPIFKESIPKESLERLKEEHPRIYKKYVTSSETRRIYLKKKECA